MAANRFLVLVVILGMVLGIRPLARPGYCAGDQAKAAKMWEYFRFRLDAVQLGVFSQLQHWSGRSYQGATQLALWRIHWESRLALAQALQSANPGMQSAGASVRSFWERADEIASAVSSPAGRMQDDHLARSLHEALAALHVCRAIRQGTILPCELLADLDPQLLVGCRSAFVRFGLLYQKRCDTESIAIAARIESVQPRHMQTWCTILASRDPSGCDGLPELTADEQARCKALAARDERACRAPGLEEKSTRKCLEALGSLLRVERRTATSFLPAAEPLVEAAMSAAAYPEEDCTAIAIRSYDRSSHATFRLVMGPWGTLPFSF